MRLKIKKAKQEKYLKMIIENYCDNGDNIYPKSMTDTEFRSIITEYLWGEHRYIADPVSDNQANVYIAFDIINEYKSKNK